MRISTDMIKNSRVYKWAMDIANTNGVAKAIACLIVWAIVSIPVDIYLVARALIDPTGFWQELAMVLVCAMFMGWLQALLLFFGVVATLNILFE